MQSSHSSLFDALIDVYNIPGSPEEASFRCLCDSPVLGSSNMPLPPCLSSSTPRLSHLRSSSYTDSILTSPARSPSQRRYPQGPRPNPHRSKSQPSQLPPLYTASLDYRHSSSLPSPSELTPVSSSSSSTSTLTVSYNGSSRVYKDPHNQEVLVISSGPDPDPSLFSLPSSGQVSARSSMDSSMPTFISRYVSPSEPKHDSHRSSKPEYGITVETKRSIVYDPKTQPYPSGGKRKRLLTFISCQLSKIPSPTSPISPITLSRKLSQKSSLSPRHRVHSTRTIWKEDGASLQCCVNGAA